MPFLVIFYILSKVQCVLYCCQECENQKIKNKIRQNFWGKLKDILDKNVKKYGNLPFDSVAQQSVTLVRRASPESSVTICV